MKKLTIALSALAISAMAFAGSASAAERINSLDLTGSQVKQIVQQEGSVLLSTGPGLFDRYVSNGSHCGTDEKTKPAYVPTADSQSTFVGYTCVADFDND